MTFILRLGFCVPSSIPFRSPAGASSMLLIFKELFLAFTLCYFTKFCFSLHQPVPSLGTASETVSAPPFSRIMSGVLLQLHPADGMCCFNCSSIWSPQRFFKKGTGAREGLVVKSMCLSIRARGSASRVYMAVYTVYMSLVSESI